MYQPEKAHAQPQSVPTIPIDVAASQAWKAPGAKSGTRTTNGHSNTKAIGSEMKQARQEAWQSSNRQTYSAGMNYHSPVQDQQQQQQRSYSPFDSQLNLGSSYGMNGHNPAVGSSPRPASGGGGGVGSVASAPPPGYLAKAGFSAFVASAADQGGCSGGDPNHQCEDPHPSALVNDQKYFRESPLMSMMGQSPYGDFIQHLQPGQRLNSEVRERKGGRTEDGWRRMLMVN